MEKNSPINNSDLTEALNNIAPGTPLRRAIDYIVNSELGSLIVVMNDKVGEIMEGGFKVNIRFTPQRLFELSKMDGAIILSKDMKKIIYANVLLIPDPKIPSNETGTRHKAGERTAKQTGALVIAISERKKMITLYYKNRRYPLRRTEEIMTRATETLQILDKERENFDSLIARLNFLEINGLTVVSDIASVLQRAEIITRISSQIERDIIELGIEGAIISLRLRELTKGVERDKQLILKDYTKSVKIGSAMSNSPLDEILSNEKLARLLFDKPTDDGITPKGYRFLSKTKMPQSKISYIIRHCKNIHSILDENNKYINPYIKKEIDKVKEQIILKQ
ncbi:MAG: DNA integrity scanning diadenylate cyclase DisA [Nanoarchaeota archaeon]